MSPPLDPREFAAIDADSWYTPSQVAVMFRRTREAVSRWLTSGKLASVKDPMSGHRLIQGRAILAAVAPLLVQVSRAKSETQRQRDSRAESALERIQRAG